MIKTLTIRTFGYSLLISAFVWLIFYLWPIISAESSYRISQIRKPIMVFDDKITFGKLLNNAVPSVLTPVDPEFSIIVEKIGANSRVIADVDASNETEYRAKLQLGVAHAKGTVYPGQAGNSYLFAHSTLNAWEVARYNAVFYLLRELEEGDSVVVFFKNQRFDYKVTEKKIVEDDDLSYLLAKYDKPVLTLQTCWPPGTSWKRLIIVAKM